MKNYFRSSSFIIHMILVIIFYFRATNAAGCTPIDLIAQETPINNRQPSSDESGIHLTWYCNNESQNFFIQLTEILEKNITINFFKNQLVCIYHSSSGGNRYYFCETTVTNNDLRDSEVKIRQCSNYNLQVEGSTTVNVAIRPRAGINLKPQVNVSVNRIINPGPNNLMLRISLAEKMDSRCISSLKEIQVINNSWRSTPYILPCNISQQSCFESFNFPVLNLCQSHPVRLRLVYKDGIQSEVDSIIEQVESQINLNREVLAAVSSSPASEMLTIQWNDPGSCSLVNIEEWLITIQPAVIPIRHRSGSNFQQNLSISCIDQSTSGNIRVNNSNNFRYTLVLYKNRPLICQSTRASLNYDPCTSYYIDLTPKAGGHPLQALILTGNFSTPFDSTDFQDLTITNVTSRSYELQWNISAKCQALIQMSVSVNNVPTVLSKGEYNQNCNVTECRIFWRSQSLTPCTRYYVNVGKRSANITTYPEDRDLKPSVVINNATHRRAAQNELELDVVLYKLNPACSALVDSVQVEFAGATAPSTESNQQTLSCNKTNRERVSCKGTYVVINQLNLCETHRVDIRPLYSESLFSDRVESVSTSFTPIPIEKQLPLPRRIKVDQQDSQTLFIEWSENCLVAKIDFWKIVIDSSGKREIVQILKLPHNCVEDFNINTNRGGSVNEANTRQFSIVLTSGQIRCGPNIYGIKPVELSQCSQYTIRVTPFVTNTFLTEFSQQLNFTTNSDNIRDLNAVNTANTLEVSWLEIPSNCSISAQKELEINGEVQPFIPSEFYYNKNQNGDKVVRWRSSKALTACTTYRIKLGSAMTDVSTPIDLTTGSVSNVKIEPINSTLSEIRWDPPSCKRGTIRHTGLQLRSDESDKLSTLLNVTIPSSLMSHTIDISNEPIQMRRPLDDSISHFNLKPCQTYYATVVTQWEDGRSFTVEQPITIADPNCPSPDSSSLTTAAVVILCLLIIILIIIVAMIYYFRIRKRREQKGLPPLSVRLSSLIPAQFTGSPSSKTKPLKHADLLQLDEELLKREFKSLQIAAEEEAAQQPRTVAARPENRIKNRFKNIHPFDSNRVVLQTLPDDPNSDYINASFIPGYAGEKKFIASQGPKRETVVDFWRMIWEQNIHLVIMVTATKEDGITKCEQYWPEKGAPTSFENLNLSLQEEIDHSFYIHRKILASKDGVRRKVTQLHFTAWPDFDIPDEPEEMIRFVEIVRRESELLNQKPKSPILVHCSAGVGRTGTYMALDYLIHQIQTKDKIDILATVLQLRRSRVSMVQSEPQYLFLYTCMAHYALTRLNLQDEAGPIYENVNGTSASFENFEYDNVGHNPMDVCLLGR